MFVREKERLVEERENKYWNEKHVNLLSIFNHIPFLSTPHMACLLALGSADLSHWPWGPCEHPHHSYHAPCLLAFRSTLIFHQGVRLSQFFDSLRPFGLGQLPFRLGQHIGPFYCLPPLFFFTRFYYYFIVFGLWPTLLVFLPHTSHTTSCTLFSICFIFLYYFYFSIYFYFNILANYKIILIR